MNFWCRACLIVLALASPTILAEESFLLEVWDVERGLANGTITGAAQSPEGYLWLSTINGLARFDGVRFRSFAGPGQPGLKVGGFNQIEASKSGIIWARAENGELVFWDKSSFSTFQENGVARLVRNLQTDTQGGVWLTLADGAIARCSGIVPEVFVQSEKFGGLGASPVALPEGVSWLITTSGDLLQQREGKLESLKPPGLGAQRIVGLAKDASDSVWVLAEKFIWKWKDSQWTPVALPVGSSGSFQGLRVGKEGSVWVWSESGIWRMCQGEWVANVGDASHVFRGLKSVNQVVDDEGRIWFGTSGQGLMTVNVSGEVTRISVQHGLPSNYVLCLLMDHEGNVWAGTRRGLVRIKRKHINVVSFDKPHGESVATGLAEAADGGMWIGSDGEGLWRYGGKTNQPKLEIISPNPKSIRATVVDRQNRLWVGTVREGLWTLDDGNLSRLSNLELPIGEARSLLADSRGLLWIGGAKGLFSWDGSKLATHSPPSDSGIFDVRAICENHGGSIWIGTQGRGLMRFREGLFESIRAVGQSQLITVWSLYEDTDGCLWIGTGGLGLARLRDGRIDFFNPSSGLSVETIYSILEDDSQNLWMGTHEGIFRVKKSECDAVVEKRLNKLQPTVFTRSDGMPTLQCASGFQPNARRTRDGRLWFATDKGVVVVDPKGDKFPCPPPSVVIEEVSLQGKSFPPESGLRLGPRPRRIEFHYTALSFSAPERVRFRYRLEGEDKEWIDAGTCRSAAFDALLPGDHEFTVSACNGDGVWNERGVSLKFIVVPIWWQRWWFKAGVTSCSVLLVAGVWWQIATRRLQRRLEDAKRQGEIERERSRIARDIHDELGASLTRIVMLSQPLDEEDTSSNNELSSIHKTARDLTRAMDEVVWAVNPRQDTLEGLVSYVSLFAQEFVVASNLSCRLDLPEKLPATALSAEARHNVFLAAKEALNNAVRHSKALEIRVGLKITDAGFTMEISDDGIGFDPSNAFKPRRGHGLQNMRDRLTSSGGSCEIASILKKGTTVSLIMPLAKTVGV